MKYLLDSNVLLEVALARARAQEAILFLQRTPAEELAVCDFSLHSLGFYLIRKTPEVYVALVKDVLDRQISILRLPPSQLQNVVANAVSLKLDFDDAFIYTMSEIHNLVLVSLDAHFDQTPRGRRTPGDLTPST